ncbi:hypothetical protein ABZ297_02745 [Nonomuraea sp. NPDC005983]|uniref:hypothetical protein n=1 Tax=Nonomuraea sp. NPDC005983 TaxID=3155595 RepID=UPI0033AB6286
MKINLPLPALLTSLFVVAVERMPFDLGSFLPWRVGRPYRQAAAAALGSPLLTITHHGSPWKPAGLDLSDDERGALRRTRQHLLVSSTAPPSELPGSAQLARATARALARECGGLVIDPLTGASVLSCDRRAGEPTDFRLADDWLGWDVQAHGDVACPQSGPADAAACDCLRVTSKGLGRFALPEITVDGAACAHTLCATNLLRTVAQRLVADQLAFVSARPRAGVRVIDDHLQIEGVYQAFGVRLTPCDTDPVELGGVRRLKVGPAPGIGRPACLRVGPPSGFDGSVNDWLCATQQAGAAAPTSTTRPRRLFAA